MSNFYFYFYFEFENFVVVLDMGVICAQFFVKNVYSWAREGFWGFNSEPAQGMLCLVIGLFRVHTKKLMEGANNC